MDRVAFLHDQAAMARSDGLDRTGKIMDETADEMESLQATVAKLPTCWRLVDGELREDCPVVPGMQLWMWQDDELLDEFACSFDRVTDDWWLRCGMYGYCISEDCYDSREAAEFALAKEKG